MAELSDLSDDENAASTTSEAEDLVDEQLSRLQIHSSEAEYKLPSTDMRSAMATRVVPWQHWVTLVDGTLDDVEKYQGSCKSWWAQMSNLDDQFPDPK